MRRALLPLVLLCATPAAGESSPAPAPAAPPTSPEMRKAVDRLVALTRPMAQFDAVMPRVIEMMLPAFLPGNEGKETELRRIVSEEFLASIGRTKPLIEDKIRQLYAQKMTVAELNAISDFYETPAGRKSLEIAPELQLEMMAFGQQAGRAAAQDALPRIKERLRISNFKIPEGI